MNENYGNNKELKIARIFPSKIYMCSLLSLISIYFTFVLLLFLYRKNMVSADTLQLFLVPKIKNNNKVGPER